MSERWDDEETERLRKGLPSRREEIAARLTRCEASYPTHMEGNLAWRDARESVNRHAPEDLRYLLDALTAAEVASRGHRQRAERAERGHAVAVRQLGEAVAMVARVRALLDELESEGGASGDWSTYGAAEAIRAALEGDE